MCGLIGLGIGLEELGLDLGLELRDDLFFVLSLSFHSWSGKFETFWSRTVWSWSSDFGLVHIIVLLLNPLQKFRLSD